MSPNTPAQTYRRRYIAPAPEPQPKPVTQLTRPQLAARITALRVALDGLWCQVERDGAEPFRAIGAAKAELVALEEQLRQMDRAAGDTLAPSWHSACPADWWPFFALLFYTGARMGGAQGLRGGDVLMHAKRIVIHEAPRRVKTREAVRDLPIAPALERALAGHLARVAPGPDDLVFPGVMQDYGAVRRTWRAVCSGAAIAGATPHDARHTFAVHAAQAGIPIVRLQQLVGHADPTMTLRYMRHAPEAYLDQDASAIAAHMTGAGDREAEARAAAARAGIKQA